MDFITIRALLRIVNSENVSDSLRNMAREQLASIAEAA